MVQCLVLFSYAVLSVLSNLFYNHLDEEETVGGFTLIVFLMYYDCKCSMTTLQGVVGWAAVCECGNAQSYSVTFIENVHV